VQYVIVLAVSRQRCVFHVDCVWTSTRGGRGVRPMWTHVDRGSQKPDFFVDVINAWPQILLPQNL